MYVFKGGMSVPSGKPPNDVYRYNFVFGRKDLNLHKLHGMVLDVNLNMLRVHEACVKRQVCIYKDHVLWDGRFHGVHVVELLCSDWFVRGKRFSRVVAAYQRAFSDQDPAL